MGERATIISQAKPSQAKPSQALGEVRPFFVVNSGIMLLYLTKPLFLREMDLCLL